MTAGTPGKIIFNFTMPIFIGNIFQQFYNMADTVIVGKFVGNAALAAVGACGTLVFLIIGFLQGVTAGFTVVTAQHFGAGNMKVMKKSVASGAVLTGIMFFSFLICLDAVPEDTSEWKPETAPQAIVTNKIGNIYCPSTLKLVNA